MSALSKKVALSALETHGGVDYLRAGESDLPLKDIMPAEVITEVRATFLRLLGAEVVALFEATADEEERTAVTAPPPVPVKSEAARAAEESQRSLAGAKRKTRMQMVDDLNQAKRDEVEAHKDADRRQRCSTAPLVAEDVD